MARSSEEWVIPEKILIPYGKPKRNFKQKLIKVRNTILQKWAYACPINSLRVKFHRWRGVHIGKNVYIGMYCIIDNMCPEHVYIMDNVGLNANCMVLTHFNSPERFSNAFEASIRPVVIGESALVAVRCTIMPGVHIGRNAIVSAGMLVDKDVPDYTMVREKTKREKVDMRFVYENNKIC